MDKKYKRITDKSVQKEYFDAHLYDELYLAFERKFVERNEVHEIMHGSSKTYEQWNMISLTWKNHRKAQEYKIDKRRLFIAKIINKTANEFPEDIIRKFNLRFILDNSDKFRRRWLLRIYHKV